MKKKKIKNLKGFTLIELLAVIVILAVIALIAVPQVLKILNKSRLSAAIDSTYGIVKSAETYVSNFLLKNSGTLPSEDLVFNCNGKSCNLETVLTGHELDGLEKLEFKGTKPKSGKVTISNSGNDIQASLVINNYGCSYISDKADCSQLTGPTSYTPTESDVGYTGVLKVVYLDPTNLDKGYNENNINSDNETKIGCMKWYVFRETDTTYDMILDHNTTVKVLWTSKDDYIAAGGTALDYGNFGNNNLGPITVTKQLQSDTSGWNSSLNPRLITANEIATIVGNTGWDSATASDSEYFYFETLTGSRPNPYPQPNKYGWLLDRTCSDCAQYGCLNNAAGSNLTDMYGYWTSSPVATFFRDAWRVRFSGVMNSVSANNADHGVRPVITVPKNKIS